MTWSIACVVGALMKYQQVNRQFPSRVIVYRDGVGDGQLDVLLQHEVPQMLECFKIEQQPDYKYVCQW